MKQPSRFPKVAADLDEWAVYADHLLGSTHLQERQLGELIAFELALPDVPSLASVKTFQKLAHRFCRPMPSSPIAFSLGLARSIHLPPTNGLRLHQLYPTGPATGTIANVTELFLQSPRMQLLEELSFAYPASDGAGASASGMKRWHRLLSALPTSCTRLGIMLCTGAIDEALIDALIRSLPAHVREVAISCAGRTRGGGNLSNPIFGVDPRPETPLVARFIQDRFDVVDLTRVRLEPRIDFAIVRDKVTNMTKSVCVQVASTYDTTPATSLPTRIRVGRPSDTVATLSSESFVASIRRSHLASLQQRYGIVAIRTLLANVLPEPFHVAPIAADPAADPLRDALVVSSIAGDWVRRGDTLTLRVAHGQNMEPRNSYTMMRNGERLEDGIHVVRFEDRISFGPESVEWTLRAPLQVS